MLTSKIELALNLEVETQFSLFMQQQSRLVPLLALPPIQHLHEVKQV